MRLAGLDNVFTRQLNSPVMRGRPEAQVAPIRVSPRQNRLSQLVSCICNDFHPALGVLGHRIGRKGTAGVTYAGPEIRVPHQD